MMFLAQLSIKTNSIKLNNKEIIQEEEAHQYKDQIWHSKAYIRVSKRTKAVQAKFSNHSNLQEAHFVMR